MASYRSHMKIWNKDKVLQSFYDKQKNSNQPGAYVKKNTYSSLLPLIYQGLPYRIDRYRQYDLMESDPEINQGLDILADFCTQNDADNSGLPFYIDFDGTQDITDSEIETINRRLRDWCILQDFENRIHYIVRNTLKYGDFVFIRDPETFIWYDIDVYNVEKVIVNEAEGKKPELYYVRDVNINLHQKLATEPVNNINNYVSGSIAGNPAGGTFSQTSFPYTQLSSIGASSATAGVNKIISTPVDARHIVHLSMNAGFGPTWPFGISVLEKIFKVYKQKELLEDAVIIYRIQRAPERRVFKIDVGNMPMPMAMMHMNQIKNEIHQRRIPSRDGGTNQFSMTDGSYNSLTMLEDYYFPVTADGKGSTVDVLPGGQNLGEINDLVFWNNKLIRGLGIPSSYIPFSPQEGDKSYSNGNSTNTLVNEVRFAKYCRRIQGLLTKVFDKEFKYFLRKKGYDLDVNTFNLRFNPPLNFEQWTMIDIQTSKMGLYTQAISTNTIAKRMALKEFLGWDETKLTENEKLWKQENKSKMEASKIDIDLSQTDGAPGLRAINIPKAKTKGGATAEEASGGFGGGDLGTETPGGGGAEEGSTT